MAGRVRRFLEDESGATAIEYGLIAALVAIAVVTTFRSVGGNLNRTFVSIGQALTR